MTHSLIHIWRIIKIGRTLASHDALFPLEWLPASKSLILMARLLSGFRVKKDCRELRPGQKLATALQELGPSFIKFGQMLSTRPDLVGNELASDLIHLQDNLPPFSGLKAIEIVEAELGSSIHDLFESFDKKPAAAASIAQVHFAVVRNINNENGKSDNSNNEGVTREVAVKILRPNIERDFKRDTDLFMWVAKILEITLPKIRRLHPVASVKTFIETVNLEMDLRMEASAAAELRENFSNDNKYFVPSIDWKRTSRRVLTTERIQGIPIHNIEELREAGHDLEDLVKRASENFFRQVFRDGYFHADMHPGNAFVLNDGTLAVVDFGIMGRIDKETRYYLADLLLGFVIGDYDLVADVHFRAGYVPTNKDRQTFKLAVRAIGEPIFGQASSDISIARLLAQLFQVTKKFDMETQPQLLLLQKTMLLAEGVGRQLAPHTNMWQLSQPLIEEWMRENRGPEAKLIEVTTNTLNALERLPKAISSLEIITNETIIDKLDTKKKGPQKPLIWPLWLAIGLLAVLFWLKHY